MQNLLNHFTIKMTQFFSIVIIFSISLAAQPESKELVIGKNYRIHSKILNEEREIYVYLPDGYFQSEARYPVLYLVDGPLRFQFTTGVVEELASVNKIPQMIVIGISNKDRYSDFTPYPKINFPTSGNSENFTRFIVEELFPFVEKYYRTGPHRILIGYSLGGLYSIYTLINHPEVFDSYIAGSPPLQHIDSQITTSFGEKLKSYINTPKSLYFTIGGREPENIKNCAFRFRDLLFENAPGNLKWTFNYMENDNHSTQSFSSTFDGLIKIFSNWEIPVEMANTGYDAIKNYYKNLSAEYGCKIFMSENLIISIIKNLIANNYYESAIEILTEATVDYPKSASLQNNLGTVYEMTNKLEEAKECYKQAYEKAIISDDPHSSVYLENMNNIIFKISNSIIR